MILVFNLKLKIILSFNEICLFISQNEFSVVSEASFCPIFLESAWAAFFCRYDVEVKAI